MKSAWARTGIAMALVLTLPCGLAVGAQHEGEEKSVDIAKRQQIEQECERIVYKYLRLFENEHGKAAELFTKDAEVSFSSTGEPTVGRDALRESWSGIDANKVEINALVANNLLVEVSNEHHATAFCYVTHYQHRYKDSKREGESVQPKGSALLNWTYEFNDSEGDWKISKMTIRPYYNSKE